MKIAVIGSGISGLTTAYLLRNKHDVTLYEKNDYLGGHTATKSVELAGKIYNIDTGFIVFNDWTYPRFIALLNQLGVASQPTLMGFSVFDKQGTFQYSGENLSGLFSDRKQIFSLSHWRMLKDIVRFNKESIKDWQAGKIADDDSLESYLQKNNYSKVFRERYLIPMGAAIWSTCYKQMLDFPAQFFIKFFHNHGLLSINNRPTWRVIKGGSKEYIAPILKKLTGSVKLAEGVKRVERADDSVTIVTDGGSEVFDQVVFACHGDEALALLESPTEDEQNILGALKFKNNSVVLHTDTSWLPSKERTWSSWNYCLDDNREALPIVTYNMNILQGIQSPSTFCVTLNAESMIDYSKVLGRFNYSHPQFDLKAIDAQNRWHQIGGKNNSWFAGAYWFNGFHEDGVRSAERVAEALGGETLSSDADNTNTSEGAQ